MRIYFMMISAPETDSESRTAGIVGSCITHGDNSPITIYMSESAALARITAERDALAAEVERLHRLIQQLLPPPAK